MPTFICEACTVREQLDRELTHLLPDIGLLALERARLIDMSHHWAETTLTQYHTKLNILRSFGTVFGVKVLCPTVLVHLPARLFPSCGPNSITLCGLAVEILTSPMKASSRLLQLEVSAVLLRTIWHGISKCPTQKPLSTLYIAPSLTLVPFLPIPWPILT
jgi:hypothetical protein